MYIIDTGNLHFNFQVGDTILYIQSFVPDCMTVLIQEYMACQSRNTSWQKIEATLFMFRSVAETVSFVLVCVHTSCGLVGSLSLVTSIVQLCVVHTYNLSQLNI